MFLKTIRGEWNSLVKCSKLRLARFAAVSALLLAVAPLGWAQVIFGSSATTTGGTVAAGGTLSAGINYISAHASSSTDTVDYIELHDGTSVLNSIQLGVQYVGTTDVPKNTLRTGTLSANLGIGVHQLYLVFETLNGSVANSPTYTVTVAGPIAAPVCGISASPGSITIGGTATLSASCSPAATNGYTWSDCVNSPFATTSSGSTTVTPTAIGTATYCVQGWNSAGANAGVSTTVNVIKLNQSINFGGLPNQTNGVAPFVISASADSNLPVTFSSATPSICTVSGATVSIAAAGGCTINANQAGNGTYYAALQVSQSFTVFPLPAPSCSISASPSSVAIGGAVTLSASCSPTATGGYTWTNCVNSPFATTSSASTSVVPTATGAATYCVQGWNSTGANAPVSTTVNVTPASQSITFGALADQTYGVPPIALSAFASSGLAVTFSSTTPSVCTVSGSTVNVANAGMCTIAADQAGNSNYSTAPEVTRSFNVRKEDQSINNFPALADQPYNAAPFAVTPTATSGLPVTLSSATPSICSVSGNTVSVAGIGGTCTITANQAGDGNHNPTNYSQSFKVGTPPAPTIDIQFSPMPMVAGQSYKQTYTTTNTTSVSYTCTSTGTGYAGTASSTMVNGPVTNAAASASWVGYPSNCIWTATGPGGTATFSATLTTVYPVPTASLSAPVDNTNIVANINNAAGVWATFTVTGSATGVISNIAVLIDGNPYGAPISGATFSATVEVPYGNHTIQLKAVDTQGTVALSNLSHITITTGTASPAVVALSATNTNVRMNGTTPVQVTFTGGATESGGQITSLALYQDNGSGYGSTPVATANGATLSQMLPLTAGSYRFKLTATDIQNNTASSTPVVVNVTNSSLLGQVNGVEVTTTGTPQLFGWVCQSGNTSGLNYQVYLNAPSTLGGTLLTQGVANVSGQPDDAAVKASCGTSGSSHDFIVDLSSYTSQYAGTPLYVQAQDSSGDSIVLPCADNNCTMPGSLRIGLSTPAPTNTDQYSAPATVFLRALLTNGSGPYDQIAFNISGPGVTTSPITAIADTSPGAYYASVPNLNPGVYTVTAFVRQGNETLYSTENIVTVVPGTGSTLALTSPSAGSQGSPVMLSATTGGTAVSGAVVQFYANGSPIGASVTPGTGGVATSSWANPASGTYAIAARLFSGSGAPLAESAITIITVNGTSSGNLVAAGPTPIPVNITPPHLGNPDAGTLPGAMSISPAGAATYSMAITVPPGTAGLVPSLSLDYNSQGTNGIAGLGWSLSGLSSVHRCGKTIAQDGVNASITFTSADRLCLDGQRLVRVNAPAPVDSTPASMDTAYWAAAGEYRTEIDNFSRVTAIAGPTITGGTQATLAFKVETKDGRTMYYGCDVNASGCAGSNNSNSYVAVLTTDVFTPDAMNGVANTSKVGNAVSWSLAGIVDAAQNHIDFDYSLDPNSGEHLATQIRYGGNFNVNQADYAAVRFVYTTRLDAWTRYVADVHNDQRSLLANIQTYVNTAGSVGDSSGTQVRNYTLSYDSNRSLTNGLSLSSGRSLLTSVQACATSSAISQTGQTSATTCLPATTFAWGKPQANITPAFVSQNPAQGWGGTGAGACATAGSNAAPCMIKYGPSPWSQIPVTSAMHSEYFDFSDFENNGHADVLEKRVADPSAGTPWNVEPLQLALAARASNPQALPGALQQSYHYFHNTGSGFVQYTYSLSTGEYFAVLAVSDFNGDGYPDLLVLTSTSSGADGSSTGGGAPRVCLSPLTGPLPAAGGNIVFNCSSTIGAVGGNATNTLPTVVDVVGDGRVSIYSQAVASFSAPVSATLCLQWTCLLNQTNLPLALTNAASSSLNPTNPWLYTYIGFEQMTDFSGTGKPDMVQWTNAVLLPVCTGDGCSGKCTTFMPGCESWDMPNGASVMTSEFTAPGAPTPPTLWYTHAVPPPPANSPTSDYPRKPFSFDSPMNMGSLAGDFNGGGYSDLYYGFYIISQSVSGTLVTPGQAQGVQCLSTGQHLDCTVRKALSSYQADPTTANLYMKTLAVADFDGDGQPDLLMIQAELNTGNIIGNSLQLCHLMGDDTTHGSGTADQNVKCSPWNLPGISTAQLQAALTTAGTDQLYVMDLQGTGRPQLVYYHAGSFNASNIWVEDGRWEVFAPTDLAAPGQALDRIVEVTNGVGATATVTYVDGLATGTVGRSGTAALAYPQKLSAGTGKFASSLTTSNGTANTLDSATPITRTVNYRYLDAATDLAGRGSLGFGTVIATDVNTGIQTTTQYSQQWPTTGMVTASTTVATQSSTNPDGSSNPGNVTLSSTSNTYSLLALQAATPGSGPAGVAQAPCGVCFPYLSGSSTTHNDLGGQDLGTSVTSNISYDNFGNLLTSTVSSRLAGDSASFVTTTTNNWDNTGSSCAPGHGSLYIVGKLCGTVITKTNESGVSITRSTSFLYDANGLLFTQLLQPSNPNQHGATLALDAGAPLEVLTRYGRNSYGEIQNQVQNWNLPAGDTQPGMTQRNTITLWDSLGRFPVSSRNAMHLTESYVFDPATGVKVSLTGPNGLTTTWQDNGFGRVTSELHADGNLTLSYLKQYQGDCPVSSCPSGIATVAVTDHLNQGSRTTVPEAVYADSAGHTLMHLTWGFNGAQSLIVTQFSVDNLGRQQKVSQPYYDGQGIYLASLSEYDALNRVGLLRTYNESGGAVDNVTSYTGAVRTLTNPNRQQRIETRDVLGQLTGAVTNANDGTTSDTSTQFARDPFGNLTQTTDTAGNQIVIHYDDLGRKIELIDPDLGDIVYNVDALGRVWQQTSPNERAAGTNTVFQYDLADRLIARIEPDLIASWSYDLPNNPTVGLIIGPLSIAQTAACAAAHSCGQLAESWTGANGSVNAGFNNAGKDADITHVYDGLGRPWQSTAALDPATGNSFFSQTDYDAWGRPITLTYQRGSDPQKVYGQRYNGYGYLYQILRGSNQDQVLWQANQQDAADRVLQAALGNGLIDSRCYDPFTARLADRSVTPNAGQPCSSGLPAVATVQEIYKYDSLGNMALRTQNWNSGIAGTVATQGYSETFGYDGLNRLILSNLSNSVVSNAQQNFQYTADGTGNLLNKTGVGTGNYVYTGGNGGPHAVKSISGIGAFTYDADGNQLTGNSRTSTWSSFDMPLSVTRGVNSSIFTYGPEHERRKQTESNNGVTTVVFYGGAQEAQISNGITTVKTYWPMGLGVEIDKTGQSASELDWTHADRLGSIIAITDASGNLKEALGFDAWGSRRNANGMPVTATSAQVTETTDTKGYTGQEMLDPLELVHLNGRVYDPLIGKFQSSDPFIQDPVNSQSFNRYSYVLNNPTNLTDPTGFLSTCSQSGGSSVEIMHCAEGWVTIYESGGSGSDKKTAINPAKGTPAMQQMANFISANLAHGTPVALEDSPDNYILLVPPSVATKVFGMLTPTANANTPIAGARSRGDADDSDRPGKPIVRNMNENEIGAYSKYFGKDIDYSKVEIHSCCGMPNSGGTTIKNDIYLFPEGYSDDFTKDTLSKFATVGHELTHVWQYQHADTTGYTLEKVIGESIEGMRDHNDRNWAYKYVIDTNKSFLDYRYEQQGQMMQDYIWATHRGGSAVDLQSIIYKSIPIGGQ